MDGSRFDGLAKALHTAPSRRRFLGSLAGAAGAAVAGRATLDEAVAQSFTASRYDLTCRNLGVRRFCLDAEPITPCGPAQTGCRCARLRQGQARVCIEQPSTGCPTRRTRCANNADCPGRQVCIIVRNCCGAHPAWGKCVDRCDEPQRNNLND
jgi:hypothetical protein